jgi:hypothetical protein
VLGVALLHLQRLAAQEGGRLQLRGQALLQRQAGAPRAGQQTALQQRGLHGQVGGGLAQAFVGRAHRGADLQPAVPAGGDEGLEPRLQLAGSVRLGALGQQHQHVDVGMGEQLAAAVAPDGQQAAVARQAGLLPERTQLRVHAQRPTAAAGAARRRPWAAGR